MKYWLGGWGGDAIVSGEAPAVDWSGVWTEVAARLSSHRALGRGHLLTEHTLRWEAMSVLEARGVHPERLRVEYRAPELAGGSLDLVVDPPAGAVVEFKFPRDSATGTSADTMTLGELLKDFLRVSVVPADERWVVQVLGQRLRLYLKNAGLRSSLVWPDHPGQTFELHLDVLAALPRTAQDAIGSITVADTVRARCTDVVAIGEGLHLMAYRVDPVGDGLAQPEVPRPAVVIAGAAREGARFEILRAARVVLSRTGSTTFTIPEIIAEMRSQGSTYAESTIRTMIVSHLCADSMGDGVAPYTDLERTGRGTYRLRS